MMLAEFGLRMVEYDLQIGHDPKDVAKTARAYALLAQVALGWTEAKHVERENIRDRIGLLARGRKPPNRRNR